MRKNTLDQLNLNHIGLLELLFASYPITSGYLWGKIPMTVLLLVLMDFIAMIRTKKKILYTPIFYFSLFLLSHEIILKLMGGTDVAHLYNIIQYCVVFLSIYIIPPSLDCRKLEGSLNWIAIISMLGLVYHFLLIQSGQNVHPIHFPFMPSQESDARLYELGNRPVSFYWEPSSFVSFMIIPLFLSLCRKNVLWSILIIISIFLSTSSNGIIFSIVMLLTYVISQGISIKYKIFISIVGVGLVIFLLNSSLFTAGVEKIANTNIEENARIFNGPLIIANTPARYLVLGIPFANVDEYAAVENFHFNIVGNNESVFISTFWLVWLKLGIIGLIFFCYCLLFFGKLDRKLIPLIITLFVSYFSQGNFFGNIYAFDMIFLVSYTYCISQEVYDE